MDELTDLIPLATDPVISPAEETDPVRTSEQEPTPADSPDTIQGAPEADFLPEEALPPVVDYEALAAQDLAEIRRLVPSLSNLAHIGELPGAARYAELRESGLTVEEAFWAACHQSAVRRSPAYDNRSHLHSAVPRGAAGNPAVMTAAEMHAARELFDDLSESEIQKLYARCRA